MKEIYNIDDLTLISAEEITFNNLLEFANDLNINKVIAELNTNEIDEALNICSDIAIKLSESIITNLNFGTNKNTRIYFRFTKDCNHIDFSMHSNFINNASFRYHFNNKKDKLKILYYLCFKPNVSKWMYLSI